MAKIVYVATRVASAAHGTSGLTLLSFFARPLQPVVPVATQKSRGSWFAAADRGPLQGRSNRERRLLLERRESRSLQSCGQRRARVLPARPTIKGRAIHSGTTRREQWLLARPSRALRDPGRSRPEPRALRSSRATTVPIA